MNEVQIFNFENKQVRAIEIEGESWFVSRDVAEILGYKKPENAVATHVDEEDKTTTLIQGTGSNYKSKAVIINESGLYSLILSSKLPSAKKFKRWVTSEVLPSIRKHGMFATEKTIDQMLADPDSMIKVLTELKKEREGRLAAEQQVHELNKKASYLDIILGTPDSLAVTQIANDYGMSAVAFNKLLQTVGIQHKVHGQWVLYKAFMGKGYTQSKVFPFKDKRGQEHSKQSTYWTQKGRKLIYDVLKDNGTLPLIEREDIE